jgi:hypothetical protein
MFPHFVQLSFRVIIGTIHKFWASRVVAERQIKEEKCKKENQGCCERVPIGNEWSLDL